MVVDELSSLPVDELITTRLPARLSETTLVAAPVIVKDAEFNVSICDCTGADTPLSNASLATVVIELSISPD